MSLLQVAIRHAYPDFALDVTFTSPIPGTTVLFGPSGSGKSTIAGAIAGLLRPQSGRITLGDEVFFDAAASRWVPARKRGLGVVFQDARLFPHMNVAANLRFGAQRARPRGIAFDDVVGLLGLGDLLARAPRDLSGGERQRVAIGRALLAQPRLLLMDEPLASLDLARKREILPYLDQLKAALDLPIVYITHAPEEVARLADTLVLIDAGHVVAQGPVSEVAARTDLPFARRDDAAAILSMRVTGHDRERRLSLLQAGGLHLWVPLLSMPVGSALRASVPARDVILATPASRGLTTQAGSDFANNLESGFAAGISVHNMIACQVRALFDDVANHAALVELDVSDERLLARITPDAVQRLGLVPGSLVTALIKSMSIDVFTASIDSQHAEPP